MTYDEIPYVEGPTELQEKILELLEAAGIDTETNDKIMELIDTAERKLETEEL